MPAAVVVAVEPAPARPELGAALVAACSSAARPRECVLGEDASVAPDATVTFETKDSIRVRVDAHGSPERRLERVLRFRREDREEDRWGAAGLVVAALVEDGERPVQPDKGEKEPPPRELSEGPPHVWLAAGALVGRGLSHGPLRYGAFVGGAYRFTGLPLFVATELAVSRAPAGPRGIEPSWMNLSLGLGGIVDLPALDAAVRPRLEGLIERQSLARDAPTPDSGTRILDGLRLGVEGAWPESTAVSLVGGMSAQFLSGGTSARVGGQKVSSFPAHAYSFFVGLDFTLGR